MYKENAEGKNSDRFRERDPSRPSAEKDPPQIESKNEFRRWVKNILEPPKNRHAAHGGSAFEKYREYTTSIAVFFRKIAEDSKIRKGRSRWLASPLLVFPDVRIQLAVKITLSTYTIPCARASV